MSHQKDLFYGTFLFIGAMSQVFIQFFKIILYLPTDKLKKVGSENGITILRKQMYQTLFAYKRNSCCFRS